MNDLQGNPPNDPGPAMTTLQFIRENPALWDQVHWRTTTTGCFAWHTAILAGGRPAAPADHTYGEYLLAEAADNPDHVFAPFCGAWPIIHVQDRARRILGLGAADSAALFSARNDFTELETRVYVLARRPDELARLLSRLAVAAGREPFGDAALALDTVLDVMDEYRDMRRPQVDRVHWIGELRKATTGMPSFQLGKALFALIGDVCSDNPTDVGLAA